MNPKNFKMFQYELGFLFEKERTKKEVEDAFKRLFVLEQFDGVRKFDSSKKGSRAKFTSVDNTLELVITELDVEITYTNQTLGMVKKEEYLKIHETMNRILKLLPEIPVGAVRVGQWVFSTSVTDIDFLTSELVNSKFKNDLSEYRLTFDYSEGEISGKEVNLSLVVSDRHSVSMHKAFEKKGIKSKLDNLVTVYAATGISESLETEQIRSFLESDIALRPSEKALMRLGYGFEK
jgi:hypothetical protein